MISSQNKHIILSKRINPVQSQWQTGGKMHQWYLTQLVYLSKWIKWCASAYEHTLGPNTEQKNKDKKKLL